MKNLILKKSLWTIIIVLLVAVLPLTAVIAMNIEPSEKHYSSSNDAKAQIKLVADAWQDVFELGGEAEREYFGVSDFGGLSYSDPYPLYYVDYLYLIRAKSITDVDLTKVLIWDNNRFYPDMGSSWIFLATDPKEKEPTLYSRIEYDKSEKRYINVQFGQMGEFLSKRLRAYNAYEFDKSKSDPIFLYSPFWTYALAANIDGDLLVFADPNLPPVTLVEYFEQERQRASITPTVPPEDLPQYMKDRIEVWEQETIEMFN